MECTLSHRAVFSVGHQLRLSPLVRAFRLAAHPDADIRIALLCSAEECGYKVALRSFGNGCCVALLERCFLVEELAASNCLVNLWQTDVECVSARAYLFGAAVGQMDCSRSVARNSNLPVLLLQILVPLAHNLAVRS